MASRKELHDIFRAGCKDGFQYGVDHRLTPDSIAFLTAGMLGSWFPKAEWNFDDHEPKRNARMVVRWADRDRRGGDNRGVVLECIMYRRIVHTCRLAPGFTANQFVRWVKHFLIEYPRFYPNLYLSVQSQEESCPAEQEGSSSES